MVFDQSSLPQFYIRHSPCATAEPIVTYPAAGIWLNIMNYLSGIQLPARWWCRLIKLTYHMILTPSSHYHEWFDLMVNPADLVQMNPFCYNQPAGR